MADDRRKLQPRVVGPMSQSIGAGQMPRRRRVVVVGLSARATNALPPHVLAPGSQVVRVPHRLLARRHMFGVSRPDLILAPLMAASVDVMDLVGQLGHAGYAGRFLAVTSQQPDIDLIRAEMTVLAPNLNLDVVTLTGPPDLHIV
ncbi:hypothetical protein V8J82_14275 [Gymnodinialimonas sp. 2305UL16-5]|uniref:hypothetical protein n=1 Tax=Gymnodinialimonas mytili TaxID=3126503 RepID=UPI0030B6C9A4